MPVKLELFKIYLLKPQIKCDYKIGLLNRRLINITYNATLGESEKQKLCFIFEESNEGAQFWYEINRLCIFRKKIRKKHLKPLY